MVDDQLHEILLGIYGQRVDPIVRILHWPTFLERCRMFRQATLSRVQASGASNYPGVYTESSPVPTFANQANLLPQHGISSKSPPESASIGPAFVALLYSVYFAAMTAIQHSANVPDFGSNVDPVSLCCTFRKDVSARIGLEQGKNVRIESVEMLQAIVVFMVSFLFMRTKNVLTTV
jgi:hypothetical protein